MDFDFDTGSGLNGNDFNASDWATNLTSIYDHRAIVGLPEWMEGNSEGYFDPLNTGNTAVDMANALELMGTGEINGDDLAVFNPVVFGGLIDAADELGFAEVFGPALDTDGDGIASAAELVAFMPGAIIGGLWGLGSAIYDELTGDGLGFDDWDELLGGALTGAAIGGVGGWLGGLGRGLGGQTGEYAERLLEALSGTVGNVIVDEVIEQQQEGEDGGGYDGRRNGDWIGA